MLKRVVWRLAKWWALRKASKISGYTSSEDLTVLYDLAASVPKGQDVVELGSYHGRSTVALASATSNRVWAVDAFDPLAVSDGSDVIGDEVQFLKNTKGYRVELLRTNVIQAGHEWQGKPIGMLFLDASHDYETTRDTFLAWLPHVAYNGIIAFHDYHPTWPGVVRTVDEVAEYFDNQHLVNALWYARLSITPVGIVC